jgi:hypothetical protein
MPETYLCVIPIVRTTHRRRHTPLIEPQSETHPCNNHIRKITCTNPPL